MNLTGGLLRAWLHRCEPFSKLLVMLGAPALVLLLLLGCLFIRYKIRRADALWLLDPEDLTFTDPPRILGYGTNEVWHGVYLVRAWLPEPRVA